MDNAIPVELHKVKLGEIRNPFSLASRYRVEINGTHQHGNNRSSENPEQNSAANLKHHQNADQEQADNGELHVGVFQAA
ncbi:hypothetical protein D3C76_1585550 [compost metagenome]